MSSIQHIYSLSGLQVIPVDLEVEVQRGMPHFSVIGMAGTSLQEAKERVRSAILSSGFQFPKTRKIVNLAPADLQKRGSHFDLAMALGLLATSGQISALPSDVMILGELGLEGGVKPIRGLLPGLRFAKERGLKEVVLPAGNANEARLFKGLRCIPVRSLREAVAHLAGQQIDALEPKVSWHEAPNMRSDFKNISGHRAAKRALLIAAAGGHHVLMKGPPGSGKSLLAEAFNSILPPLSEEELLESLSIFSIAGHGYERSNSCRPFRRAHSSITRRALMGGGTQLLPGEVSLAHRGVLFMDELPEFKRPVIEQLREPLEQGEIHIQRSGHHISFPCEFQLISAMNPCPCGYFGDPVHPCECRPDQVARYQNKISGPLLDRIDLHLEVPRLSFDELDEEQSLSSSELRRQVVKARERQMRRALNGGKLNARLRSSEIKKIPLEPGAKELLRELCEHHALSGRSVHKILKLALSISDLAGKSIVNETALAEAAQYRSSK